MYTELKLLAEPFQIPKLLYILYLIQKLGTHKFKHLQIEGLRNIHLKRNGGKKKAIYF